jgi:hypothetical protein
MSGHKQGRAHMKRRLFLTTSVSFLLAYSSNFMRPCTNFVKNFAGPLSFLNWPISAVIDFYCKMGTVFFKSSLREDLT